MSCSLGLRGDRLAVDHAVGGGEADLDVLGVCRHDAKSNHEAKLHDQDEASRPHPPPWREQNLLGSEPYILALADRAGNPELLERGDEIGDLRIGMNRRWREARALHAARHRRAIDGQHVDPVVVEQAVGYRLAVDW